MSSPCTWGCFFHYLPLFQIDTVFPMHVGVFLNGFIFLKLLKGLPHARGGVSSIVSDNPLFARSSPCTWGCFRCPVCMKQVSIVFPMHVGVFLPPVKVAGCSVGLPHARGGVSKVNSFDISKAEVFPMHVGVFPRPDLPRSPLQCLPHARGGVSKSWAYHGPVQESSPCTWGCFYVALR